MTAADAADQFWVCNLCHRGMLIHVNNKWFAVLGSTPCLVYEPMMHSHDGCHVLLRIHRNLLNTEVWPMVELDYKFENGLPELVVDECRVPSKSQENKFQDCLHEGESVKAICFDMTASLESKK